MAERSELLKQALQIVRNIAWPDWTPSRSSPTPPWEDEKEGNRLGHFRIAQAFVDEGWGPMDADGKSNA